MAKRLIDKTVAPISGLWMLGLTEGKAAGRHAGGGMGYVDRVLRPGERIIHRAKVHWVVYIDAAVILVVAFSIAMIGRALALPDLHFIFLLLVAAALAGWGFVSALKAVITQISTELAITNFRVIVKTGLIRRDTAEINRAKIEGVAVKQSVLGRLLGYGTVAVSGSGGSLAPVKDIDDPLAFRNQVPLDGYFQRQAPADSDG